jgi:hypothetical protein
MRKCANISPHMRRPLVIYDFATAPFWIYFLFYQCACQLEYWEIKVKVFAYKNGGTSIQLRTVKSSNFVILFSENIFFHQTFFRWPHFVFRYWNLYRMCLAMVHIHFALHQCLIPKMLFFLRVTKLGDRHLISSPSQINITQQRL